MSERSIARVFGGPFFLARQMCSHCHGDGTVPTPEMAGWRAIVERAKDDYLAANRGGSEKEAYARAREIAGEAPEEATATCQGCNGRGFHEVEIAIDELRKLLDTEGERKQ